MNTFIVPDCHGNGGLVRELLEQEGILKDGVRVPNKAKVIQLGDLANCVASSIHEDLDALNLVRLGIIDEMLVGNHEHPYFGGPAFGGYWPDAEVRQRLREISARGGLKAAHAVGDVLITHAGLTSMKMKRFAHLSSAKQIARELNLLWEKSHIDPIFNNIGPTRGGWSPTGGILWADWSETKPRNLRQVVGHTVGKKIRRRGGAVCIDLGGNYRSSRLAGAWIRKGVIDVAIYERGSDGGR